MAGADQWLEAAFALADNHRRRGRKIHDCGRLETAVASIENRVDRVLEALLDLETVSEWLRITRQDERRAHQRLAELGEKHMGHWMIRNPHSNGAAALMLQSTRCLARSVQQKCVWARCACLQQSKLPRIEPRVAPDVSEVRAHEREMVMTIRTANRAQPLKRVLVIDVTPKRVA